MSTINVRLTGAAGAIDATLEQVRGLPGVDRAEEKGIAVAPGGRDDASSAGLPDDTPGDFRDVEIHAVGDAAFRNASDRLELAARDAGVVVEWQEPF